MPDREKINNGLTELKKYLPSTMWEPINDAIAMLKEQQHKIWELNEINEYLDDVKKDQEHQIDVLKKQFDKDIIVRCKDCKQSGIDSTSYPHYWCSAHAEYHDGAWFCADGEAKE